MSSGGVGRHELISDRALRGSDRGDTVVLRPGGGHRESARTLLCAGDDAVSPREGRPHLRLCRVRQHAERSGMTCRSLAAGLRTGCAHRAIVCCNADVYRDLTRSTATLIHTGEEICLRQNFKELIERNAVRRHGGRLSRKRSGREHRLLTDAVRRTAAQRDRPRPPRRFRGAGTQPRAVL